MKTIKEVKDRITELFSKEDHLLSFVLQAMYIEVILRAYSEAKLKACIGGADIYKKLMDKLLEDFCGEKKKIGDLLDSLVTVGWLENEEKGDLKTYFEFRNSVTHRLAKEIRNNTFIEDVEKHYKLGQKIISFDVLSRLDPILAAIDENRSIYGHGKIFGGGELSRGDIYKVLNLSLEGKSENDIVNIVGIKKTLIKQIIKNVLAITIEIDVLLKGHKKRSQRENADFVIKEVGRQRNVRDAEIIGDSRVEEIAFARHICMYLLNKKLKYSFPVTAKLLSRKDHTTVVSGVKKIENLIEAGRVRIKTDVN